MKNFCLKLFVFNIAFFLCFFIVFNPSFAFAPSDNNLIDGIDVSSWQKSIDYNKVASSGIKIVYIKASEGIGYVDPYLEANYTNAKSAGLKVGFYHYVTSRSVENAIKQADFFVETIAGKVSDCRLAMDFESFGSLSKYEINQIALAFLNELEKKSGMAVVLYSNTYTAKTIFDSTVSNYPLWVAHYYVSNPSPNGNWDTWIGWQYTDVGEVPGITSYVDRDKFTSSIFLDSSSYIPGEPPSQPSISYKKITIKWGDTLSQLALEYGTTVQRLVEINNIANPNLIYAGNTLLVPIGDNSVSSNYVCTTPYVVKAGDTLSQIAKDNNTTVSAIASKNNIKNVNLIYVGQIINIPTLNCDMSHKLYVVQKGDTLWGISRRFGVSVANIVMLNRIANPNLIYPGNVLRIS